MFVGACTTRSDRQDLLGLLCGLDEDFLGLPTCRSTDGYPVPSCLVMQDLPATELADIVVQYASRAHPLSISIADTSLWRRFAEHRVRFAQPPRADLFLPQRLCILHVLLMPHASICRRQHIGHRMWDNGTFTYGLASPTTKHADQEANQSLHGVSIGTCFCPTRAGRWGDVVLCKAWRCGVQPITRCRCFKPMQECLGSKLQVDVSSAFLARTLERCYPHGSC